MPTSGPEFSSLRMLLRPFTSCWRFPKNLFFCVWGLNLRSHYHQHAASNLPRLLRLCWHSGRWSLQLPVLVACHRGTFRSAGSIYPLRDAFLNLALTLFVAAVAAIFSFRSCYLPVASSLCRRAFC